jgi:hypothetical protein
MEGRPLGITLLCILGWLEALVIFFIGLALVALGVFGQSLIEGLFSSLLDLPLTAGNAFAVLGEILAVIGVVLVILGVVSFWFVSWLWKMQKRGWKWTMYSQVMSIIVGMIDVVFDPTSIIWLVFPAIIVIYLWMKKDLFK